MLFERGKSMLRNDQQSHLPEKFVDPEPISIAIAAFAAAVGTAGLIINWANKRRDDRVQREEEQEKYEEKLTQIRIAHSKAERALETLTMHYRMLTKFYDGEMLRGPMILGRHTFSIYRDQADELYRLKKDFIDLGIELEKAVDELSSFIDNGLVPGALEIAESLRIHFEDGRHANTLVIFLINSGFLFMGIGEFLDKVAIYYKFKLITGKRESFYGSIHSFNDRGRLQ
jgi:hypothetical protein